MLKKAAPPAAVGATTTLYQSVNLLSAHAQLSGSPKQKESESPVHPNDLRHFVIRFKTDSNVFVLTENEEIVAENSNPKTLANLAFDLGAYSVKHDYHIPEKY